MDKNSKKIIKMWKKNFFVIYLTFILFIASFNFSAISYEELPDLIVENMNAPNDVVEGDNVTINVTIKNIGSGNVPIGTPVGVGLFIDNENEPVFTNLTYEGFSSETFRYFNLYWIAEIGFHSIVVKVDYNSIINESDESNNEKGKFIDVSEGPTNIINQFILPQELKVGIPANINISIKNVGKNTSENISTILNIKEEDFIEIQTKNNGLLRGEIYNFSFEWTPVIFGDHTFNLTIKHGTDVHSQEEKTSDVEPYRLEWWNTSWHYRKLIGVSGSGNFSRMFNFTELLESIGIVSKIFENNTIRIIEYSTDGEILDIDIDYNFSESSGFHNKYNATGILTWEVTPHPNDPVKKYYYIYFDVKDNKGLRDSLKEKENMVSSTFDIIYESLLEGWWDKIIKPLDGGYTLVKEVLDIEVLTIAQSKEVKAYLKKENTTQEYVVSLININSSYLDWHGSFNFTGDAVGNWTIQINSSDDAGFQNNVSKNKFYVGKPDLAVTSISYKPSKIYETDIVSISADVRSYNITLENVNVSLTITDSGGGTTVHKINVTAVKKDIANVINFSWKAEEMGDYNIEIKAFRNDIEEWNISNNKLTQSISVIGLPDLGVVDIIIPSGFIREGTSTTIRAVLNNTGKGIARNYTVRLYLSQGVMDWFDNQIQDTVNFTLDVNETIEVNLTWNPTLYGSHRYRGEWIVGILIFFNNTYRDSFIDNNRRYKQLTVVPGEKNPPEIRITEFIDIYELGSSVNFMAEITDQSGIKIVNITITNPKEQTYKGNMASEGSNKYSFIFNETSVIGNYNYSITAIDNSFYKMRSTFAGFFTIIGDKTPPIIDYFGIQPIIQLKGNFVNFSSISRDVHGVKSVKLRIIDPDKYTETKTMTRQNMGKYLYKASYNKLGKYVVRVSSEDNSGNIAFSENKEFWITTDLNDIDGDGMPNWWEERYGFNPYNPLDADQDEDGDGIKNIEEYKSGDNPLRESSSLQEFASNIKENWIYLIISIISFSLILVFSIVGIRRVKYEDV